MLRFWYLVALAAICDSCSHTTDKDPLLESLQQSMERSSLTISYMSQAKLNDLNEKTMDPATSYKARFWFPKAMAVHQFTKQLSDDIDRIINPLNSPLRNKDADITNELRIKLTAYTDSILATDSLIRRTFGNEFSDTSQSRYGFPSLWTPLKLLDAANDHERTVLLTQLKLSVTERGNAIISYCSEQIATACNMGVRSYSLILGQNSHAIVSGEKLEIVAGVGSFSTDAQLKVKINGKPWPVSENGTAKYNFTPTGKPGKYHIPVTMEFVDEFGKPRTYTQEITFRLLKAQ